MMDIINYYLMLIENVNDDKLSRGLTGLQLTKCIHELRFHDLGEDHLLGEKLEENLLLRLTEQNIAKIATLFKIGRLHE